MLRVTAAALICAALSSVSLAEAPAAAFVAAEARVAPQLEPSHVRTRVVRLADTLDAQLAGVARAAVEVRLNLFEDAAYEATTDLLEMLPDGDLTWRGVFEGGYATLVRRGGETAGLVRDGARVFEIVPVGAGASRVTQVHVDALPGCGVDEFNLPGNPLAGKGLMAAIDRTLDAERDAEPAGADVAQARGANPTLDQLVAYTPNALAWVGGTTDAMSAFIDNAILDMNTVLANSGIAMETRVVYKHPLAENETGSGVTDRDDFRINGDGKWDEIHELRDDFGADMGHILVRDSNVCGIAAQIYRGASNADQFAFCLTAMSCVSNLTFVHEVGHVIGCAHDLDNSGGFSGTFSFAFGWHDPDETPQWHTVMSYSPGFPSQRVPYFSTPNVIWDDGNPLGDAALADNSRTINLNIDDITAWRGSVGLAPTSFETLTRAGENVISWQPVTQATGYEVWRGASADVAQASLRGFRTEPTFTDSSVTAGATYYYFVRSRFADGGRSPFSAPVEVVALNANPADFSGDGVVDAVDLATLIGAWGTATADLSGDGDTNATDLAILIGSWG